MAVITTHLSTDSAAVLDDLIGEDATAMFESDPKFIEPDSTSSSSSENVVFQRDLDDTEDSEEEEDEELDEEDEEFDEDEEDEEEEEDEDEEEEEDEEDEDFDSDEEEEEEVGSIAILASGSTNLRGPVVNGNTSVESELEQDDDAGDETVEQDEYVIEGGDDGSDGSDSPKVDRAIDAALRMSALVAVTSQYAASV